MKLNTFILDLPRYRVVAPAAVIRTMDGGEGYRYRNELVPANADLAQLKHLLSTGAIVEVD